MHATDAEAPSRRKPPSVDESRVPSPLQRLMEVTGRLFPPSPELRLSRMSVLLMPAAVVVGVALGLARQTGKGALATLYAEDGRVFLADALNATPPQAFGTPYMGYLHTAPRVLAELAAVLPLQWAAAILSGGSTVIVVGLAMLVFRASSGHFQHMLARVVVAGSMVVLPVAKDEVLNNAANLHWFLIVASFWVLLWRTERGWELATGSLVVAVTGLSDPLTVLLTPIALLRVAALRGWRSHLFTGAWAVGIGLQIVGIAVSHAHRHLPIMTNVTSIAAWYARDVIGGTLFGTRLLGDHHSPVGLCLTAVGIVALAVLVVLALRHQQLRQNGLALLALMTSVILFVVPVFLTGVDAPRYSVAPVLLCLAGVVSLLDGRPPGLPSSSWTGVRLGAISLLAIVWVADFPLQNARSQGPVWTDQLYQAEASCKTPRAGSVYIAIAPPGWQAEVGCSHIPAPGNAPAPRASTVSRPAWPGPDTTGVPRGTVLSPSGTLVVTTPGAVIDALDITGCISVRASNVMIKRTKVHGAYCGSNVIEVGKGVSGVMLVDVEVDGQNTNPGYAGVGGAGGFTCLRCNVHRVGDGFNASGSLPITIEDSWVHDLYIRDDQGTHNQDIITNGFSAGLVIRHNNLENRGGQTAVISLFADFSPVQNVTIDNNLLNGGGYSLYGAAGDGKPFSSQTRNIVVTNNHFGRRFYPRSGFYGPVAYFDGGQAGSIWSGNVWDDTGAAVRP